MGKEQLSQDAWPYKVAKVGAKMGERSRILPAGRSGGRRIWKVVAEFGEGGKPVIQSQAGGHQNLSGGVG